MPLFSGLPESELGKLVPACERRTFRAGDAITANGAPADGAYVLLSGSAVRPANGASELVYEPGAVIGELAMFIDTTFSATVIARTACSTAVLGRERIAALLRREPVLTTLLVRRMRERLYGIAHELKALSERLAQDPAAFDEPPAPAHRAGPAHADPYLAPGHGGMGARPVVPPQLDAGLDTFKAAGGLRWPYGAERSNFASTGTWSEGRGQSRGSVSTASSFEAEARAGVAQMWSSLRPRLDDRQFRAR